MGHGGPGFEERVSIQITNRTVEMLSNSLIYGSSTSTSVSLEACGWGENDAVWLWPDLLRSYLNTIVLLRPIPINEPQGGRLVFLLPQTGILT